tara:strand:+ start:1069 stop:2853 length:1785 start_codon:yes stop_codon:yes gene_type:complete
VQLEEELRGEAYKLGQGQHKISCPSCSHSRKKKNERTLSFKIDGDQAVYQCWHCGMNGFVPMKEVFPQINVQRKVKPVAVAKKMNTYPLVDQAVNFLNQRGISKQTAELVNLKYSKNWIQSVQKEVDCIHFPYTNKGEEYAYKIRSIESKGFSCNGAPQTFFNIDNVKKDDLFIICEGEMDALSLIEAGYTSCVSVPNGAVMKVSEVRTFVDDSNKDNKFKFLWDAKDKIDAAGKIIIATDADDAGQAMAEEMARRIGKDKVYQVHYPNDCKDANDVLLKHGKDGIDTLITGATPWPVTGLFDAKHFFEEVDEIYEKGIGSGASTGYKNVDELYSIVEGQMTVVTGHPSSGKSEFIDQLMINLAETYGWRFAICSFENEPRIHIAKLISKYLKLPFFDGKTPRMTKEEMDAGKKFVQMNFSFLYQADGTLSSVDSIIERLKIAVLRHGVRGAIIDPYNYIQKDKDISETDWVSDVLTRLRVFAQAHGIHIWFVAHPTKMMRDANGVVPAPKGYDISGSAAWFAKADVGLTVHRPDPAYSPLSEIHIWKCRFSWTGKQGKTELSFDSPTSTYHLPYATSVASTSHNLDEDINFDD